MIHLIHNEEHFMYFVFQNQNKLFHGIALLERKENINTKKYFSLIKCAV